MVATASTNDVNKDLTLKDKDQTLKAKDQNKDHTVLALDLEGVHDVKLHHPSSSVATSNQ